MLFRCRKCGHIMTANKEPFTCPSCGEMFFDVFTSRGMATYGIMEEINSPNDPVPTQDEMIKDACEILEMLENSHVKQAMPEIRRQQ